MNTPGRSPSPPRIVPVDRANFRATVEVCTRAFESDPYMRYLAPDDALRRRWLPVIMEANVRLTLPDGHTYALTDDSGTVIGAICAVPPGRYPHPTLRDLSFLARLTLLPDPWTPNPVSTIRKGVPYLRAWERMHCKEPHWYVYVIAVDPPHQGRGYGRMLMSHILKKSVLDGVPTYLETQTESNVPVYLSMGFSVTERTEMSATNPGGPDSWGMIRPPSPRGAG